jgi:hypothetical protein
LAISVLLTSSFAVFPFEYPAMAQVANARATRAGGARNQKLPDQSSRGVFSLSLSRGAAASAASGGSTVGGCALSQSELQPITKVIRVKGSSGEGTANTEVTMRYSGFGVDTPSTGADSGANAVSLGASTLEVSSVATANLAVLETLPNIDPAALAAVQAAVAAAETGVPAAAGTGEFVCQLAICTPEEIREAADLGIVPVPRYEEAYTAFTLVQEVESTDLDFINDFAASAF